MRIGPPGRAISDIEVRVDPTSQPDWIRLNVPPGLRIVVSEVVVEEPSLGIAILAGQYLDGPPSS